MAVVVEFVVPGASPEQVYAVEELTQERGLAAGGLEAADVRISTVLSMSIPGTH